MKFQNLHKLTLKSPFDSFMRIAVVIVVMLCSSFPLQAAENIQTTKLQDGRELILNGIGKAKKLSDSFYIGALYLQQPFRSVDNITYINNYKRMRLKIASKRVSARRFAQYWKEAISINSPRNIWEPQVADVLAFTSFFNKTLKMGDVVDIDFIPAMGTYVHINGVAMGRIRNPGFYNLVIMVWLGNRPPNEQFKLGVIGGNDGETAVRLQQEFESLNPTAERIAESKRWLQDAPATRTAAKKTTAKKNPNKKVAKKPANKTPSKKKTAITKPQNAKTGDAKAAITKVSAATTNLKAPDVKVANNNQAKKKPSAKVEKSKSTNAKSKQSANKVVEQPKILTSSQKLKLYAVRNDYEKELRQTIRQYQQYPIRQMLRNRSYKKQMEKGPIESEGVLWVKIARTGAVISSKLEQSTGISILDDSALSMVEKADPLPEMPNDLEGREFEFLVQLKFVSPRLN
jgi:protein TonB